MMFLTPNQATAGPRGSGWKKNVRISTASTSARMPGPIPACQKVMAMAQNEKDMIARGRW